MLMGPLRRHRADPGHRRQLCRQEDRSRPSYGAFPTDTGLFVALLIGGHRHYRRADLLSGAGAWARSSNISHSCMAAAGSEPEMTLGPSFSAPSFWSMAGSGRHCRRSGGVPEAEPVQTLFRNPVIFVTEVVALVASILCLRGLVFITGGIHTAVDRPDLRLAVVHRPQFANFAEAVAEGARQGASPSHCAGPRPKPKPTA